MKKMNKTINKIMHNKYFTIIFNIIYILGFVVAKERGFMLWYFLITTTLMTVAFWKPLYSIMKVGGDMYASWCRDKSYQLTKKVYPGYEREEDCDDLCDLPKSEVKLEEE